MSKLNAILSFIWSGSLLVLGFTYWSDKTSPLFFVASLFLFERGFRIIEKQEQA